MELLVTSMSQMGQTRENIRKLQFRDDIILIYGHALMQYLMLSIFQFLFFSCCFLFPLISRSDGVTESISISSLLLNLQRKPFTFSNFFK